MIGLCVAVAAWQMVMVVEVMLMAVVTVTAVVRAVGMVDVLRAVVVRKVLLPKWRALVKARGIFVYWHDLAGRTAHAEGGVGRKRDLAKELAAFEGQVGLYGLQQLVEAPVAGLLDPHGVAGVGQHAQRQVDGLHVLGERAGGEEQVAGAGQVFDVVQGAVAGDFQGALAGQVEGGFQGRTNKLVDACYSFWQVGACQVRKR